MQPITAFHRSVRRLFTERVELRRTIDFLEADASPYASSKIHSLWSRIDEIDRQIGVAYYWHCVTPEGPANEQAEVKKAGQTPPPLDS